MMIDSASSKYLQLARVERKQQRDLERYKRRFA